MECLAVGKLPEGSNWLWELKLDGYRAIAVKSGQKTHLYSRNGKSLDQKYQHHCCTDVPHFRGFVDAKRFFGIEVSVRDEILKVLGRNALLDGLGYSVPANFLFRNGDSTNVFVGGQHGEHMFGTNEVSASIKSRCENSLPLESRSQHGTLPSLFLARLTKASCETK
jgi:hypothetical protein